MGRCIVRVNQMICPKCDQPLKEIAKDDWQCDHCKIIYQIRPWCFRGKDSKKYCPMINKEVRTHDCIGYCDYCEGFHVDDDGLEVPHCIYEEIESVPFHQVR